MELGLWQESKHILSPCDLVIFRLGTWEAKRNPPLNARRFARVLWLPKKHAQRKEPTKTRPSPNKGDLSLSLSLSLRKRVLFCSMSTWCSEAQWCAKNRIRPRARNQAPRFGLEMRARTHQAGHEEGALHRQRGQGADL